MLRRICYFNRWATGYYGRFRDRIERYSISELGHAAKIVITKEFKQQFLKSGSSENIMQRGIFI